MELSSLAKRNGKRCMLPSQRLKVEFVVQLMKSALSISNAAPRKKIRLLIVFIRTL